MPRNPYNKRGSRGPRTGGAYSSRFEKRGYTKENHMCRSFWTYHTMDQVMNMTEEELDAAMELWLERYFDKQLTLYKK